jgi:ferritin-like metal-binding protein YciE
VARVQQLEHDLTAARGSFAQAAALEQLQTGFWTHCEEAEEKLKNLDKAVKWLQRDVHEDMEIEVSGLHGQISDVERQILDVDVAGRCAAVAPTAQDTHPMQQTSMNRGRLASAMTSPH